MSNYHVNFSEENENDNCDDGDDEEEEDTVLNFVDEESETDESDTEPEQDGGTQEESFDDVNMMEVAVSDCLWQHVLVELLKSGVVHIFAVSNIHSNFYSLSDPVEESSQSQGCFCHLAHGPGFILNDNLLFNNISRK